MRTVSLELFHPENYPLEDYIWTPAKNSTVYDYLITTINDSLLPPGGYFDTDELIAEHEPTIQAATTMLSYQQSPATPPLGSIVWNTPLTWQTLKTKLTNPTETQKLIHTYQQLIINLYLGAILEYPIDELKNIINETIITGTLPTFTGNDTPIYDNEHAPSTQAALTQLLEYTAQTRENPEQHDTQLGWFLPQFPSELELIMRIAHQTVLNKEETTP